MGSGRRRGRPSSVSPTVRQRAILRLVALGLANKEIALELRLAEPSVKKHVSKLFRRYGVPNRAALVRAAIEARDLETAAPMSTSIAAPVLTTHDTETGSSRAGMPT